MLTVRNHPKNPGGPQVAGTDRATLALIVLYPVVAVALVPLCRQLHRLGVKRATTTSKAVPYSAVAFGAIAVIVRELWGLFVDDAWLATGVVLVVAARLGHAGGIGSVKALGRAPPGRRPEHRAGAERVAPGESMTHRLPERDSTQLQC